MLVDLPKDVASANFEYVEVPGGLIKPMPRPEARQLHVAHDLIAASKQPLVYAGGGVRIARASSELVSFVDATGIPVVTTLQGLGAVPVDHPLNLGMLGMHGTKAANYAVQQCDLLIAVGVRFDDRVTGKLAEFAPHAKVIHMDVILPK